MPATKFDKDVSALQNAMIPAVEKAAGHALLPSDRYAITKLIRESLVNPEPGKVAELKAWVTPKAAPARSFTETAKVTGFLEQAPAVPSPAPSAPTNTLLEESIKADLPYLRQPASRHAPAQPHARGGQGFREHSSPASRGDHQGHEHRRIAHGPRSPQVPVFRAWAYCGANL